MNDISCSQGIFDCEYPWIPDDQNQCASYNNRYTEPKDNIWVMLFGAIVMAAMAFGIGANDVANAWGTGVGSGAISLKYAVLIAGIMNILGATLLGYGVSDKIEKSVSDITEINCWSCGYCNSAMGVYSIGMLGALMSAALFLLTATFFKMPVSTTHAIVGGVVGMTITEVGTDCIDWWYNGLGGIVASWLVSPLISGLMGAAMYLFTNSIIFKSQQKWALAFRLVPIFYSLVTWVMVFMLCQKSNIMKTLPLTIHLAIAAAAMAIVFLLVIFILMPKLDAERPSMQMISEMRQRDPVERTSSIDSMDSSERSWADIDISNHTSFDTSSSGMIHQPGSLEIVQPARFTPSDALRVDLTKDGSMSGDDWDMRDAMYCFKYLLVFNAALESFAHGANDTANSTGPFSAILVLYREGRNSCHEFHTSPAVMFVGGLFVALGIIVFGGGVIETIGKKLTHIDFHKGFCIEFSACVTIVVATLFGLPVSTTHCQIGSVVFVGIVACDNISHVNFRLVGQIAFACLVTVPLSAALSAGITYLLKHIFIRNY